MSKMSKEEKTTIKFIKDMNKVFTKYPTHKEVYQDLMDIGLAGLAHRLYFELLKIDQGIKNVKSKYKNSRNSKTSNTKIR